MKSNKNNRIIFPKLFNGKYLKQAKFSRKRLLIFALGFALVGSYALFRSFAATPTTANLWVDLNGGSCTRTTM